MVGAICEALAASPGERIGSVGVTVLTFVGGLAALRLLWIVVTYALTTLGGHSDRVTTTVAATGLGFTAVAYVAGFGGWYIASGLGLAVIGVMALFSG